MNNRKWLKFFLNEDKQEAVYNSKLSLIDERIFDSLDMTSLAESEIKLLMEGRKENVIKKYGDSIGEAEIEALISFDEQYRFKHLAWMAREVARTEQEDNHNIDQEEKTVETIGAIKTFVRYQQSMKKRDINQYADVEELLHSIQLDVIQPRIEKARQKRMANPDTTELLRSSQGTVVYEDERYFVVRPNTREASCHFGARTRWCIAQHGNSYFSTYTEGEGKVFYFIKDDTKKNEEFNYKMAVEMSATGEGSDLYYNNIWDRNDDPTMIESSDVWELASSLTDDFEMPSDKAEMIASAIEDHCQHNMPESPMADLQTRVDNGEWDGGFVECHANLDDYDGEQVYLTLHADVTIPYVVKNADLARMLEADEISIVQAEWAIAEAFGDEGEMYEHLDDALDIGASKYWWPEYSEHIEIDIRKEQRADENAPMVPLTQENPNVPKVDVWVINIQIRGFQDNDTGGMYHTGNRQEAESFCEYMQEEWGERNELEILEVLDAHLLRYIPEYGQSQADAFIALKSEFVDGRHGLSTDEDASLYYTVDDDDEETSDLNLHMEFTFDLNPDYLNLVYNAEDFKNASGNIVKKPNLGNPTTPSSTNRRVKQFLISDLGGEGEFQSHLEKAIYNVYQLAYEQSLRQLKLDFGEEWQETIEDQWVFPDTPSDIKLHFGLSGDNILTSGQAPLVPTWAKMKIQFDLYIPFHKSEAELQAMKRFFLFVKDNYDQIYTYINRYLVQYANPHTTRRGTSILSENLLFKVLNAQYFLQEVNNQLGITNTRRKQK